jgi:thioredoxin 1
VLVDFYAKWCGACKTLEPSLQTLASRYKGRLKVVMLDAEESPGAAHTYQIRATPTLIIFKRGKLVEQVVGALPERELMEFAAKHMA